MAPCGTAGTSLLCSELVHSANQVSQKQTLALILRICSTVVFFGVVLLMLRAARQRAIVRNLPPDTSDVMIDAPRLAIIIPARNEAARIGACVSSALRQSYPGDRFQILVVDDESDDETATAALDAAGRDMRISVVAAPPLPPRWTGKAHACWIGTRNVRDNPEWLCFLDADVIADKDLLRSAVTVAEAEKLDLLSLAPRQILVSFAERLVLPCGFYVLAFCKSLERTEKPGLDEAVVSGMFMLVRRKSYELVAGHRAVAAAISEDTELARAIRRAGGTCSVRDGTELLATRMYSSWHALRIGIAKNLVDMLGGPFMTILTAVTGLALAWGVAFVPAIGLLLWGSGQSPDWLSVGLATCALALAVGFHVAGARHFAIPLWYGLLFPLGYTAGAFIAVDSLRRRIQGQVAWKGRSYAPGKRPHDIRSGGR
jgi:chlorobactene glucosyltransferase